MASPKWNEENRFFKILHVMSLIFSTGVIIFGILSIISGFKSNMYINMTGYYCGATLICDGIRNFYTSKKTMILYTVCGVLIIGLQLII